MRCLGRLVFACLLTIALAAAWLYRDDLARRAQRVIDPAAAARRTGHPSAAAFASATAKVDSLTTAPRDSILLSADEVATLVSTGAHFIPNDPLDSVAVELGDRTLRIRSMVNTAHLPPRILVLIPGTPAPYEEVIASGTFTPVREGIAELRLDRVLIQGLPVPSAMVAELVARVTGHASDGRLEVAMPAGVSGFRVRPTGMAIYPRTPR